MAIKRKERMKAHTFENCPPAPCLYPVADPRKETTAKPYCDESVTPGGHFPMDEGMLNIAGAPRFCFNSHTNGKKGGGE